MILAWSLLVRKSFRDLARTPAAAFAAELVSAAAGLAVYWFTARAIGPALSFGGDYFTFVVLGETALGVPLLAFSGPALAVRGSVRDGLLEPWLTSPVPVSAAIGLQTLSAVPREWGRAASTWALAYALFGFRVPLPALAGVLVLQAAITPAILGLGFVGAAALVRFRRGLTTLTHLGMLASVFAGAFFPLSALPEAARHWSRIASPFTWLVEAVRAAAERGWTRETSASVVLWGAAGSLLLVGGALLVEAAFGDYRRRGEPLVFAD